MSGPSVGMCDVRTRPARGSDSVATEDRPRLVLARRRPPELRSWNSEAAGLLAAAVGDLVGPVRQRGGSWLVLGGPGTGKTALLVDAAATRIASGGDLGSVLLVTGGRSAARALRTQLIEQVTLRGVAGVAAREPVVRTIHSYAFGLLQRYAARCGNPPPRLLTGARHDASVREMLCDEARDRPDLWPAQLRPALPTAGFAEQVRDLILRATERGMGPEDLVRFGYEYDRPEWVAAGRFAIRHEQVMLLRWSVGLAAPEAAAPALNAAELVGAALDVLASDGEVLAAERARVRCLLVDDAQHVDPQAGLLIRVLAQGAGVTAIAGDPDQGVFDFRGADRQLLTDWEVPAGQRIVLAENRRCAEGIREVSVRAAGRLPGNPAHRPTPVPRQDASGPAEGQVVVRVVGSAAKEAALISDWLRRAHVVEGVAYSQMAVVVRSVPAMLPALRRALLAAQVPMRVPAPVLPLARQRGVAWLLTSVRAVLSSRSEIANNGSDYVTFGAEEALELLQGPLGGADQIALRRLRRGIRRIAGTDIPSAQLLRSAILGHGDIAGLTALEAEPLQRVIETISAGREAFDKDGDLETVLWALWESSGLATRWLRQTRWAGSAGAQADRDLDAVIALFAVAADFTDRMPTAQGGNPAANIAGFVEQLSRENLPHDTRTTREQGESVEILSAHAAAGREWDLVVVAGVQEGTWPDPRPRGGLLRTEELLDRIAGIEASAQVSRAAPLLAAERRLFYVATSRARRSLLVTAVESTGDQEAAPSRFLTEIQETASGDMPELSISEPPRALAVSPLVAELRAAVCDTDNPARRDRAAWQLARLACCGVPGAAPDQWYGMAPPSCRRPLWNSQDGPVGLSPSTVEMLQTCPLRWVLERHGGSDGDNPQASKGVVVHTLVQALASAVPPDRVRGVLEEVWPAVEPGNGWYARSERRRAGAMLDAFETWVGQTRSELSEVGVEIPVDCTLSSPGDSSQDDAPDVRIRGRIDRLERDQLGRLVVVDVKTGKTVPTKSEAREHAQLATYQIALARGGQPDNPGEQQKPEEILGGGRLVHVAKPTATGAATERSQEPLTFETLPQWESAIRQAALASRGPDYQAIRGEGCRHCRVKNSCPVWDTGRQVTE